MPGSVIRPLRSGAMPDTSRRLLDPARGRSLGALGRPSTGSPESRTPPSSTSPPASRQRRPTGAQLIRRSGGTARDVRAWRKLSRARRARIRARVSARGGSLTRAVRRIG